MPRMIDLVRACALPSHQMMTASKGALRLPAEEMVEILVYLAEHNKILGGQARLTLAGWEEASAKTIASNPNAPKEVLDYWLSPRNLRAVLFPLLLENTSVTTGKLSELASSLKGECIDAMIASPRVQGSPQLLTDLSSNKQLSGVQTARVQELISGKPAVVEPKPEPSALDASEVLHTPDSEIETHAPAIESAAEVNRVIPPGASGPEADGETADPETEDALIAFFAEHASEIAADGNKPFQPIGGTYEETRAPDQVKAAAAAASASPVPPTPVANPIFPKKLSNPEDEKRGSVLQKITKLDVKGRIQLAMKGTKEERSILVRDGTKLVAIAVLDSPKVSDGEVEHFASQKNVLEAVLRAIPMKRRFMKNYAVVRNLVFNPRTPLDVSLGLMKNLLLADLRNLCGNKEVADTVRKLAMRMFKQKSEHSDKS